MMQFRSKSHRAANDDNVVHLITQADRARKLAADHGSSILSDLYEMHAQLCEQNASRKTAKIARRPKLRVLPI